MSLVLNHDEKIKNESIFFFNLLLFAGSMYRFNGYDRRLDRVLECVLLVMEAFQGFEDIFQYEIGKKNIQKFCF